MGLTRREWIRGQSKGIGRNWGDGWYGNDTLGKGTRQDGVANILSINEYCHKSNNATTKRQPLY